MASAIDAIVLVKTKPNRVLNELGRPSASAFVFNNEIVRNVGLDPAAAKHVADRKLAGVLGIAGHDRAAGDGQQHVALL